MSRLDPGLLTVLTSLRPYLQDIVIVGGWVPYLYRLSHPTTVTGALKTRDIDIAVPRTLPLRGVSIDRLLVNAGFECEFRSLSTPPATRYVARQADVEVEFITDAPGADEGVVNVQPDLTAQELHYTKLLLGNTWRLDLASHVADAVNCRVNVPTPAAFILHKGLSFKARRDTLKKEKDLYYVFYIVDGFPEWANWIRLDLPGLASRTPAWFRQCAANLDQAFSTPGSAGVDALLRQRPETAYPGMSPDQFRQYAWGAMRELVGTMMVG